MAKKNGPQTEYYYPEAIREGSDPYNRPVYLFFAESEGYWVENHGTGVISDAVADEATANKLFNNFCNDSNW